MDDHNLPGYHPPPPPGHVPHEDSDYEIDDAIEDVEDAAAEAAAANDAAHAAAADAILDAEAPADQFVAADNQHMPGASYPQLPEDPPPLPQYDPPDNWGRPCREGFKYLNPGLNAVPLPPNYRLIPASQGGTPLLHFDRYDPMKKSRQLISVMRRIDFASYN